jgi:hypothetical protein
MIHLGDIMLKEFHVNRHLVRNIQLCANAMYRGVFTSDVLYRTDTLPKDMAFRKGKHEQWSDLYDWIILSHQKCELEDSTKAM